MLKNRLERGKSGLRQKVGTCNGGQVRYDSDLDYRQQWRWRAWDRFQAWFGGWSTRARTGIEMRRQFRVMRMV